MDGGLGVGASISKGVPIDKRSIVLEGTVRGIGMTLAAWSPDAEDWVEISQTGVYVRKVDD